MKRSLAGVVTACVVVAGLSAVQLGRLERRGASAPIPQSLEFKTATGPMWFRPATDGPALVVVFHTQCTFCVQQLDELEAQILRLHGADLYLLSVDDVLDQRELQHRWPRLQSAAHVTWGTISPESARHSMGVDATPALFLYDRAGALIGNWRGRMKIAGILDASETARAEGCNISTNRAAACQRLREGPSN